MGVDYIHHYIKIQPDEQERQRSDVKKMIADKLNTNMPGQEEENIYYNDNILSRIILYSLSCAYS